MTDWPAIIEQLRKLGVRQFELARQCGVSEETIGQLKRGLIREPRYSVGVKILAIYAKVTQETTKATGIEVALPVESAAGTIAKFAG